MLNAEKFRDEILEHVCPCDLFALLKENKIVKCCEEACTECYFNGMYGCDFEVMFKWLLSEYKEQLIKVSKLEYEILKYVQKEGFNFIIRNNYGDLFIHETKPIKPDSSIDWCTIGKSYALCAFNDLFQFVKFEDKDPTSVEEVLENCEVVDDD